MRDQAMAGGIRGAEGVPVEYGGIPQISTATALETFTHFDRQVNLARLDETVTLLQPPSTFSRCFNVDGEVMSAK